MNTPSTAVAPTLATLACGARLALASAVDGPRAMPLPDEVSRFLEAVSSSALSSGSGFSQPPHIMFVRVETWYGEAFSVAWR